MADKDLPRKRDRFTIKPIIERKRVITGFTVKFRKHAASKKGGKRAIISQEIQEAYPQITKCQLNDARFMYDECVTLIELNQFSEPKRAAGRRKLEPRSK